MVEEGRKRIRYKLHQSTFLQFAYAMHLMHMVNCGSLAREKAEKALELYFEKVEKELNAERLL